METQLSAAAEPDTYKCDRDNCGADATFSYAWEWGEKGYCCSLHATLLQQIAGQISRSVMIVPLQRTRPEPLQRDERTRLKATAFVLEEELTEAKNRGLELYRINGQLRGDVQLMKVRNAEADAQLKDAHAEINRLNNDLQKRELEHGEMALEIDRLKTLVSFSPSERRELGLSDENPTVVDG